MFTLEALAPAPFTEPWHEPTQERLRQLASGRRRVAYFYERADNSTFRYRVYNMTRVLNDGSGDVSAVYFYHHDLNRLHEIAALADVLVVCRARYDHKLNHLVDAFHRRGKRVFFDTDDFVFDTKYVHLLVETLDLDVENPQVWQDWFAYVSRIGATLKLCDAAITTTAPLAERIRDFADLPVAIVPNYMNREQLAYSEQVLAAKAGRPLGQSGLIHFGYFSGSPSHNRDFAIVASALEALLEEDPRTGVVVVGYIEAGPALERFGSRVTRFPFVDYVNLQRLVGSVEFNLMPLQYNVFTNCKSELKYFEAAAVGSVSIASPGSVYGRAITHGVTGYLAQAHQWKGALTEALAQSDGYWSLASRARTDALSTYSWQVQRPAILDALELR